jgi:hypothetical protein
MGGAGKAESVGERARHMRRDEIDFDLLESRMDKKHHAERTRRWVRHLIEKRVCYLYFSEGMRAPEIAAAVNRSVTTIRGILFRFKREYLND